MSVFLSRIALVLLQNSSKRCISSSKLVDIFVPNKQFLPFNNDLFSFKTKYFARHFASNVVQPKVAIDSSNILMKKKTVHKKTVLEDVSEREGHFLTIAYATAISYDLKGLKDALIQQKLYEPATLKTHEEGDVVVANAVYSVGDEPREIIFFREGAVVFWNCSELEARNVLDFVKRYEVDSYPRDVVEKEREIMTYVYQPAAKKCHLQDSSFVLVPDRDNSLEKYTFSHAMAQSARLGAWESHLETLAEGVRGHTALMERDGAARLDKQEMVRKLGQLFSLRHRINVESDLLDTPDFYWEEERLERLYSHTVSYFTIARRTRVLNERLSHCVELLQLLWSWAADRHHVRLEWMVIALILAEVCFELLHFAERSIGVNRRVRPERPRSVFSNEIEENMFQDLSILDT